MVLDSHLIYHLYTSRICNFDQYLLQVRTPSHNADFSFRLLFVLVVVVVGECVCKLSL